MDFSHFSHAQHQRLAFIDFCLQYFGQIARADLIQHFSTGLASGTRDFTLYKELAPNNLILKHQTKLYYRTEQFIPIFEHNSQTILTSLCRGFGDGFTSKIKASEICFDAISLIQPRSDIIATLMRAIQNKQAVNCQYVSLSSGTSNRELIPHAIVNNGHRWHVRGYDRKSQSFRDFVCTRFIDISEQDSITQSHELILADQAWMTILPIVLKPHPQLTHPLAIELDYNMDNGKVELEVRAALVGYLLQQWQVDCSKNYQLNEKQYPLVLANIDVLANTDNALLAPGFKKVIEGEN
ncbi:MAG: WYL domain-containing protein [Colwellia sp.]|nr:WYL domain-containing protein [Colwellia sp.]